MAEFINRRLFLYWTSDTLRRMRFYIHNCHEKHKLKSMIEDRCGTVVENEDDPYAVPFAKEETTANDRDVFSIDYIKQCCAQNKLLELKKFRLNEHSAYDSDFEPMDVLRGIKPWPSERRCRSVSQSPERPLPNFRKLYSKKEDEAIIQYLLKNKRYERMKGNTLWKQMERKGVLTGRTWQSMKSRIRTIILQPDKYGLSDDDFKKLGGTKTTTRKHSLNVSREKQTSLADDSSDTEVGATKRSCCCELLEKIRTDMKKYSNPNKTCECCCCRRIRIVEEKIMRNGYRTERSFADEDNSLEEPEILKTLNIVGVTASDKNGASARLHNTNFTDTDDSDINSLGSDILRENLENPSAPVSNKTAEGPRERKRKLYSHPAGPVNLKPNAKDNTNSLTAETCNQLEFGNTDLLSSPPKKKRANVKNGANKESSPISRRVDFVEANSFTNLDLGLGSPDRLNAICIESVAQQRKRTAVENLMFEVSFSNFERASPHSKRSSTIKDRSVNFETSSPVTNGKTKESRGVEFCAGMEIHLAEISNPRSDSRNSKKVRENNVGTSLSVTIPEKDRVRSPIQTDKNGTASEEDPDQSDFAVQCIPLSQPCKCSQSNSETEVSSNCVSNINLKDHSVRVNRENENGCSSHSEVEDVALQLSISLSAGESTVSYTLSERRELDAQNKSDVACEINDCESEVRKAENCGNEIARFSGINVLCSEGEKDPIDLTSSTSKFSDCEVQRRGVSNFVPENFIKIEKSSSESRENEFSSKAGSTECESCCSKVKKEGRDHSNEEISVLNPTERNLITLATCSSVGPFTSEDGGLQNFLKEDKNWVFEKYFDSMKPYAPLLELPQPSCHSNDSVEKCVEPAPPTIILSDSSKSSLVVGSHTSECKDYLNKPKINGIKAALFPLTYKEINSSWENRYRKFSCCTEIIRRRKVDVRTTKSLPCGNLLEKGINVMKDPGYTFIKCKSARFGPNSCSTEIALHSLRNWKIESSGVILQPKGCLNNESANCEGNEVAVVDIISDGSKSQTSGTKVPYCIKHEVSSCAEESANSRQSSIEIKSEKLSASEPDEQRSTEGVDCSCGENGDVIDGRSIQLDSVQNSSGVKETVTVDDDVDVLCGIPDNAPKEIHSPHDDTSKVADLPVVDQQEFRGISPPNDMSLTCCDTSWTHQPSGSHSSEGCDTVAEEIAPPVDMI